MNGWWNVKPGVEADAVAAPGGVERLRETTLAEEDTRLDVQPSREHLQLGVVEVAFDRSELAAGGRQLAALDEDVDPHRPVGRCPGRRVDVDVLDQGECLVPAAEDGQRCAHVPERHQLLDALAAPPRDLELLAVGLDRVEVAIAGGELVGEVVERARERPGRWVLAPDRDRVLDQREALLFATVRPEHEVLGVQRVDEHVVHDERLGDLECPLDPLGRGVDVAEEVAQPRVDLGQRREVGVRLLVGQHLQCLLDAVGAAGEVAREPHRQPSWPATRAARVGEPGRLVERDRRLEALTRRRPVAAAERRVAGLGQQLSAHGRIVDQVGGLHERPVGLLARAERRGSAAGADERLARPGSDLPGVVGIRSAPGRRRGSARRRPRPLRPRAPLLEVRAAAARWRDWRSTRDSVS